MPIKRKPIALRENILPVPVKDKTPVLSFTDRDVIIAPFSMVHYESPTSQLPERDAAPLFEMYYLQGGEYWLSKATNSRFEMISRPKKVNGPMESVIKVDNKYYSSGHYWYGYPCFTDFSTSPDGINFTKVTQPRIIESGEDRTMFYHNKTFYCYVRVSGRVKPRSIGLMTSTDFLNWTPIQTILTPDVQDVNKEFYSMCVIKKGNDWFGLLHVLELDALKKDVEQLPPYLPNDNILSTQLTYSTDGMTWVRCNGRKDFIPRGDTKQQVALPTIVEDRVLFYSLESTRHHTDYEQANPNGRYFKIEKYEMTWNDLLKYKP